jgi:hypothetical protein
LNGAEASAFKLLTVILKISFGLIMIGLFSPVVLNEASFTLLKYTIFFELPQEVSNKTKKQTQIRGNKNLAII